MWAQERGADQVSASERAFIIRELHSALFHGGFFGFLLNSTDPFSHGEPASMIAFEVWLLDTQLTLLRFSSVAAVCVCITATLLAARVGESSLDVDAWGWCTGTTQRDGMGREEGGGFRMGNTGISVADSFRYLAKLIEYCKV